VIGVFLLDDHELTRAGFRLILDGAADITVVGDCGTGEEALDALPRLQPDVLLCDLYLPGISGVEVAERVLRGGSPTKVIALSAQDEGPLPRRLLEAGAHGYLCKGCSIGEMLLAIRSVHRGERYISRSVAMHLALQHLSTATRSPFDALSPREMEILLLLLRGLRGNDIARRLHLSKKTISTHKMHALAKLGVSDMPALTRLALRHAVIDPISA
jgi:DNA-binding NarL/FixJ family response regulator